MSHKDLEEATAIIQVRCIQGLKEGVGSLSREKVFSEQTWRYWTAAARESEEARRMQKL